jgi:hypothetical protein
MRLAIVRRALVATATLTILAIPVVSADSTALTDLVTTGTTRTVDLGTVQPSQELGVDVNFVLTCSGTNHVDSTQAIRMNPGTRVIPSDGGFHMGSMTFGLGSDWPADGQPCPAGIAPTIGGPFHMTVTAPSNPGSWTFRFSWIPGVTPAGSNDSSTFAGSQQPTLFITMTVADNTPPPNTPPVLNLPADQTVEGNTTNGATVGWTATASDAEDASAPAVSCTPASGAFFPLGTTTVQCSATDGGGLTTTGSFKVTVQDTTPPTLAGVPGDVTMTTSDPSGATLTYTAPTATDTVDSSPSVGCVPASGSVIPVGATTVTCTATDASGNANSATFTAHVRLAQAVWEDPAAGGLVVNGSRTVPIKVGLMLDSQPVTDGSASVAVVPCAGGPAVQADPLLLQANGRWMGHLSTDGLANGCYQVVASANGVAIGSFEMDVHPDTTTPAKPKSNTSNK